MHLCTAPNVSGEHFLAELYQANHVFDCKPTFRSLWPFYSRNLLVQSHCTFAGRHAMVVLHLLEWMHGVFTPLCIFHSAQTQVTTTLWLSKAPIDILRHSLVYEYYTFIKLNIFTRDQLLHFAVSDCKAFYLISKFENGQFANSCAFCFEKVQFKSQPILLRYWSRVMTTARSLPRVTYLYEIMQKDDTGMEHKGLHI